MSYTTYKILHIVAVLFMFTSLGAIAVLAGRDGVRRTATIVHGIGLAVVLVAGFGLLARLGFFGDIPGWAWAKIVLWLALGAAVVPLRRRWGSPAAWLLVLPVLGGVAAWLAIAKPF